MTLPKLYKPGDSTGGANTFSVCIYGRGGAGKTTLLGTMPGKGLVIDVPQIEGGTFVLEAQADRIDVVPVEKWNDIEEVRQYLEKGEHEYKWVAIDSITAMQELAKRKTISDRGLDADPHTITLKEYGKIGQLLGDLIYKFRLLPIHIIWIAQERNFGNDEGTKSTVGPAVSPGALGALLPSMLLVGRLYVYETSEDGWERRLRIGPSEDYYTKARAKPGQDVPPIVKDPNLSGIIRFLLGRGDRPAEAKEEVPTLFG